MTDLLVTEDVTVHFDGLAAVDCVSLTVPEGKIVGLIGPNGAGKSTLFNAVSGLQPLDGGRVFLRGRDVTGLQPHERARLGAGRSFQNLGLMMDQTVETNVMAGQFLRTGYGFLDPMLRPWRWAREERRVRERVGETLDRFGLAAHRHEVVRGLSFGIARFVELAGVLTLAPAIMLLDEPTTGLDPAETARLVTTLAGLRGEGRTILVVAHNVGFVMELCDWVYVLASGRIVAQGPPEEIQRDPVVIEVYLGASPV
ncbi:MAG: ABC transporter ATP-binding protein [Actinomycetota bacterium]